MKIDASHALIVPALLLAIVIMLGLGLQSNFHLRVAALIWISALAAIGLNLLVGFAGQVSLGHAGFFGIGAYGMAILPNQMDMPPWAAFFIGIASCGVIAYLLGKPILRLKGNYLAIGTLGLGFLVTIALTNEAWLTGGPDGVRIARLEVFGQTLAGPAVWYWLTGVLLVFGAWLACNLVASPTGRALRALQDSEIAARVAGIDVASAKLTVFVISALYAAVAGACFSLLNGFINPEIAGFLHSIELIAMVVLGGMGSIFGSVLGAAILVALPQFLTGFHDYEQLLLGLVIMMVIVILPAGIVPSIMRLISRAGR